MKRVLLLLSLVLLLSVACATAKTVNRVAAIVNDEVITTYQLDKAVISTLAKKQNQNQLTAAQFDKLKGQALSKLINDKLLQQRIKELGITVSAAEVDGAIMDVQRKNNFSREQLAEALTSQGMSLDVYKQQIEDEILRYRLLGQEVNYKVLVTSREVRDYFDKNRADYDTDPKINVNRLSFTLSSGNEKELAELNTRISVSRDLLINGENFDKVAAGHGAAASGVSMGLVAEVDLAEAIKTALVDVPTGGVSEAVEIGGKLHLFQVVERFSIDGDPFDFYRGEIEEKLKQEKTDVRFKEWQRELRENAYVEFKI